jgi:Domain of unknown function DUF29
VSALYDEDFYSWTREQADLLRRAGEQRLNTPSGLDWEHLALEVWELGLSLELQLYNRYVVLIAHLLKWHHQPRLRGGGWRGTVNEQRRRIARLLRKNPALKPVREAEFTEAYGDARELAADDTGLAIETFPTTCPFTIAQVEDREFWPDAEGGL